MLTDEDVARLQSAIGSKSSNGVQVHLTSTLTLTSDQEIAVLHSRNSGPIGASEVFIGSQRVSRLADGGTSEESRTVMLRRGTHVVRWLLSGEISPGGLLIAPANRPAPGSPPAFTLGPDQAMQDALRRLPTRQSLAFGDEK
jgi:hypothetical protein